MNLITLSQKYNFTYPEFYAKLWADDMLDWNKGWNEPWSEERNWYTEVYPTIKDNPPILLHSGYDFEMLSPQEILDYTFFEWWDPKHNFIPFARTGAGDLFAFYQNIEIDGSNPIVLV